LTKKCPGLETLLERLEEKYWGDQEILYDLPKSSDTNYWGDSILIIEGKIANRSAGYARIANGVRR
jgi:hypothetical protein